MSVSRNEAIDSKMNQIARQAMLQVVERHAEAVVEVLRNVGTHLHESDLAALDDHLGAMQRFTKTLGASGL